MDTKKIEDIIADVQQDIYKNDLSVKSINERMHDRFGDASSKLSLNEAISFATDESRLFTQFFVHDLLLKLADEGYLVDPSKKK